ncbi:Tigger transposable element-derived protein 6 [Nosema granulosis]|uniref:Tigger transposable element-derived protein 6 n=1 Tax=Nosema granulosis TaxID=83296 RepID=A0A9P6GZ54_9MICR|nr:Tigger transposable element-derived protein 6 [Nosema granulosis]
MELSNIELLFLSKNTTSLNQPLDMGIIKAFKCHYFNALVDSCYFENTDNYTDVFNSITIKYAIIMVFIAWEAIEEKSMISCFKKGLVDPKRHKGFSYRYSRGLNFYRPQKC